MVFPFLIANDLIASKNSKPSRYVIDFQGLDVLEAAQFPEVFKRIQTQVLPVREHAAKKEEQRNKAALAANPNAKTNKHHANFLKKWWIMSYPREGMVEQIQPLSRYIVCGQVTKRPIFEFVSPAIRPNAACIVFAHADDYSFGILQSSIHWLWFINRCSTLTERFRYTPNTAFDTFPWPQKPNLQDVKAVAAASVAFRKKRSDLRARHNLSLRDLYRALDLPGDHPLKVVQAALDAAVRKAYGMASESDVLAHLLDLNAQVAASEENGDPVQGPGLPALVGDSKPYITDDCLEA